MLLDFIKTNSINTRKSECRQIMITTQIELNIDHDSTYFIHYINAIE